MSESVARLRRQLLVGTSLCLLAILASVSLLYAVRTAFRDSADLERRAIEAKLVRQGKDPYSVPDMTYPPTAIPVFVALVPTGSQLVRRALWVGLNLLALSAFCGLTISTWGRAWPTGVRWAFVLAVAASKPVRAGIALGQFHLIPTTLLVAAEALASHSLICGTLVAVALAKPTMSLPYLAVLVARRRYPSLTVAIVLHTISLIGVTLWLATGPIHLTREWFANARLQSVLGTIDMPSVLGRSFPGLVNHTTLVTLVVLALSALLIFFLRTRSSLGLLAIATFSAAVMTYHRHYDLVLLLPTLAYLIDSSVRARSIGTTAIAAVFAALLVIPSDGRFIGAAFEATYDALLVPACYAAFAALIVQVAREPVIRKNEKAPAASETS